MRVPKILIAVIISLLIFLRLILKDSSEIMTMVTVFNIVATLFVILEIAEGAKNAIVAKIERTCAAQSISMREKKRFLNLFWIVLLVIVVLFIGVTLRFFCTSIANDILSIGALGLSLLIDEIVMLFEKLYKV